MGKTRRCRAVVLGASVAALGATGACPAANAAKAQGAVPAPRSQKPARLHHHAPKRRARPVTTPHHGDYVYEVSIEGELSFTKANMTCSGLTLKLTGVTGFPATNNASALWYKRPEGWNRVYTITTGPATTITVPYTTPAELTEAEERHERGEPAEPRHPRNLTGTALTSQLCADARPNAGVGSQGGGVATWRLPQPAVTAAALMSQTPTNIDLSKLGMSFNIKPNGTITVNGPYS